MSRLDGTAKRASNAILHALLENAAAKTSTEKQINTDKPEEAPKETKEALVKKVQKPEVPHKEHIVESAEEYDEVTRKFINDFKDFCYDNDLSFTDVDAEKMYYHELYVHQGKEYADKARACLRPYWDSLEGEDLEECGQVTSVELNEEADGLANEKIAQLQEKIADLQAYLDATPEVPEDERASIQAEIDEMLDEINYFENGLNESSLKEDSYNYDELEMWVQELQGMSATEAYETVLEQTGNSELADDVAAQIEKLHDESGIFDESLTEAENPANTEINRKILNTIKTKPDAEPKFKKDLEDAGLKVTKDFGEWYVEGPNGRRLSKYDITGGKDANFNPEERKHADWLNLLTKERDLDKNYQTMKNRAYRPTQRIDKYKHYNSETKSWEPGVDYSHKNYDRRQKRSQGYDFNNLRRGTQDIQDFKQAKDDEDFHHRAQKWSNNDIERANKELADFQASISDKIAQLQRNIERAKEDFNRHETGEKQAQQTRQDILNKKREARNK